jgi:TonB family protein
VGVGDKRSVASIEALDLHDFAIGDIPPDERDRFDALDIVIGDAAEIEDDQAEPHLAASPFFIEFDQFDEPAPLDPDRVGLIWELPPPSGQTIRLRSPLVSLAAHLLPLLLIVLWPNTVEVPKAIPVQLVFEEQPPPPPQQPAPQPLKPQPKMENGRLSSVDMGQVQPKDATGKSNLTAPPAAGEPQPNPVDVFTTTNEPTPPPLPLFKPTPPKEQQAAVHLPKPSGAPVPHHEEVPHEASRTARFAGPAATRDEYLAYLVSLTRQHIDLLPLSVVGDRRGETIVSVVVYDNGTIGPIGVSRSSGYPDIDQRIEQMVAAVHKFPPLPQWYQGNAVQLELTLRFPEALEKQ